MTTATTALPLRPRGAARHAANAAAAAAAAAAATAGSASPTRRARRAADAVAPADPRTTDAAASTPVASVSTTVAASPSAVTVLTTEAAASPPAVSVPDVRLRPVPRSTVLPRRRALRSERRRERPGAMGRAVTDVLTLPLRSIGSTFSSVRALPVTATAVVACLVVSVATPQAATAAGAETTLPALDGQEFTAATTSSAGADRDSFTIGRIPVRPVVPMRSAPAVGAAGVVRPVAGAIPAAGGFGSRWVRGCGACSTNHAGLDFAAPTGTTVLAAMPGRVLSAGVSGGYGNQVLVQHADGVQTRYAHLSRIDVRTGESLVAGAPIGAVGNTGVSTGPHLHFEVVVEGTPVDPAAWLRARGLL